MAKRELLNQEQFNYIYPKLCEVLGGGAQFNNRNANWRHFVWRYGVYQENRLQIAVDLMKSEKMEQYIHSSLSSFDIVCEVEVTRRK